MKTTKKLKTIIYSLLLISIFSFYSLIHIKTVFAGGTCNAAGQCINDKLCADDGSGNIVLTNTDCGGSAIIGGVTPPDAIANVTRDKTGIDAVVFFISRLINFGAIIAGIITIGNFIAAGVMYVSGGSTGDTGMHIKVKDKITYGIIGLVVIVAAYTIVGLVGLIFFGNPLFTLNPILKGL